MSTPKDESQACPIPHVTRLTHTQPGSHYILPTDKPESDRLNLQHDVLKNAFGGKILFVPIEDHPSLFVLDSGTGTGVWLLEVAEKFAPSAILHGIDIEGRHFPLSKPTNLSFSLTNITDLPLEWSSRFDIVHQRLLFAALTRRQWSTALANMFRVLRPGGYVQLCESENFESGNFTMKLGEILRELYRRRDLVMRVYEELPRLLENAGFRDVKIERSIMPVGKWAGQVGIDGRNSIIGAFRGMKIYVLRMGGFGMVKSEEEMDELLDNVEKEWDETEGMALGFCMFVAQKPTAST